MNFAFHPSTIQIKAQIFSFIPDLYHGVNSHPQRMWFTFLNSGESLCKGVSKEGWTACGSTFYSSIILFCSYIIRLHKMLKCESGESHKKENFGCPAWINGEDSNFQEVKFPKHTANQSFNVTAKRPFKDWSATFPCSKGWVSHFFMNFAICTFRTCKHLCCLAFKPSTLYIMTVSTHFHAGFLNF